MSALVSQMLQEKFMEAVFPAIIRAAAKLPEKEKPFIIITYLL
jgi:hypothetical protein